MAFLHFPYLVLRNEVFYFRRAVPLELRSAVGRSELVWSLKTRSVVEAQQRVLSAVQRAEAIFSDASIGKPMVSVQKPLPASHRQGAPKSWPVGRISSPCVVDAWAAFLKENAHDWKPATIEEYGRVIREFASPVFVGNKTVDQITRNDIIYYRDCLRRLPASMRRAKLYRSMSIPELLAMEIPKELRFSDRTVNERLIMVGSLFGWCQNVRGWMPDNIMYKTLIREPESKERAIFTSEEISKLFYSAEYLDVGHKHPYQFWVPLLGLYTGARVSEICQLDLNDLVVVDGIYCLRIIDDGDQEVKTAAGKRLVPVHPHLINLGLTEYVSVCKGRGFVRLFPEIVRGKSWGSTASRWFTKYRRRVGVPDEDEMGREKVFHSFRKTVVTHLRNCRLPTGNPVDVSVIQQIVGHERNLFGATEIYTQDFSIESCQQALMALDFGLPIEKLAKVWQARY